MTSRARIAELSHTDVALLVPYRGQQRALGELQAERATLTPEDYSAVRLFLGGGKRGRTRARELMPLACPGCACRLTHFERSGRPAYFAATVQTAAHGPDCELFESTPAVAPAEARPLAREPHEVALAVEQSIDSSLARPSALAHSPLLYAIETSSADAHARPISDPRALLVQALNRAVPAGSQVQLRGQRYTIVSAAELHLRQEGESVAVYGRLSGAEWNQASGRLTLRAAPRTVQVWATAGVPRALLGLALDEPVEAPVIRSPVPFIAFGTLRKLAAVCGIPVIRSESIVLLQPLTFSMRVQSAREEEAAAALADELDALLSALPPLGSEAADVRIDA